MADITVDLGWGETVDIYAHIGGEYTVSYRADTSSPELFLTRLGGVLDLTRDVALRFGSQDAADVGGHATAETAPSVSLEFTGGWGTELTVAFTSHPQNDVSGLVTMRTQFYNRDALLRVAQATGSEAVRAGFAKALDDMQRSLWTDFARVPESQFPALLPAGRGTRLTRGAAWVATQAAEVVHRGAQLPHQLATRASQAGTSSTGPEAGR